MNSEYYINKIYENIYASFVPGKKDIKWNRDIEADINVLSKNGISQLICLIPTHELAVLKISFEILRTTCLKNKINLIHYPITDNEIPENTVEFIKLIKEIDEISTKEKICIVCKGGLGRTGLVAACLLILKDFSATNAIKTVRENRKHALGRLHQQKFVYYFSKLVKNTKMPAFGLKKVVPRKINIK